MKRFAWREQNWTAKNLLELNARRVLISGNIMDYGWASAKFGFAVLLTPRNQDVGALWSTVEDITFSWIVVRHASASISLQVAPCPTLATRRVVIKHNFCYDINATALGGRRSTAYSPRSRSVLTLWPVVGSHFWLLAKWWAV